jgi:hypothetical protein
MSAHTHQAPLLSQITVEHGPSELLGEFFFRADEEVRRRGITLSLGTFEQLVEVNKSNRSTWLPLNPTFDPAHCNLGPDNAFCILGRNVDGDVVATQACRVWDMGEKSFSELCASMRFFYDDPDRSRTPEECCRTTFESARSIVGRIAFAGAVWYRRDYRGLETQRFLARIARAYAYTRWDTDYSTGTVSEKVMRTTRMAEMAGHKHVEWAVDWVNNPVFGSMRFAFVWMNKPEMLDDLSQILVSLETDAAIGVQDGSAKQQA